MPLRGTVSNNDINRRRYVSTGSLNSIARSSPRADWGRKKKKKKSTIRSYWKNWLDTTNSPSIEKNAESAIRYLNLARLFTTADVINCGG